MTLPLFTKVEPGVNNYTGGCLEAWPPLLVTCEDMPLDYWQNDQEPGDTTGLGVNDVWFMVEP